MANFNSPSIQTPKDVEKLVIEDYNNDILVKDICQKYNIHQSTVPAILRRYGYKIIPSRSRSLIWFEPNPEKIVIEKYKSEKNIKKIANDLKISAETITKILNNNGVEKVRRNQKIIIPKEILDEIENFFSIKNYTIKSLAIRFNYSEWVIQRSLKERGLNLLKRKSRTDWEKYLNKVRVITEENWKNYFDKINPNRLKRGKYNYHLDHIYSINNGFKNKIHHEIVGHWSNLQMLDWKDNCKKSINSAKTKEQLIEDYERSNDDLG